VGDGGPLRVAGRFALAAAVATFVLSAYRVGVQLR
jgi:hypothetical protein